MDWQKYVDEQLLCEIDGHHLTSVAIIGHDGKIWGKSSSFPEFKSEEIASIMNDFNEPGSLAPTGFYFGSTKYMMIQGEPGSLIRGNKRSGGIIIKKTAQALIVGIHNEPMKLSQCNTIIERDGSLSLGPRHVIV